MVTSLPLFKEFIMSEVITLNKKTQAIFPYVKDKLLIDLANGTQVVKEQNAIQRQQTSSIWSRVKNGLSGQSAMRQANINEHLNVGLESCQNLLNELSQDVAKHSIALIELESRQQGLSNNIIELIHFSVDLKKELADVKSEVTSLKRIMMADLQMNRLMDKWKAGGLNQLSPLGRCYTVLDALYWGAFGQFVRNDINNKDASEFFEHLRDKLIIRLQKDLDVESDRDVIRDEWLRLPENSDPQLQNVLSFQGNWCLNGPKDFPITFTATQWPEMTSHNRIQYQNIPFALMDIERVTKRLIAERFGG